MVTQEQRRRRRRRGRWQPSAARTALFRQAQTHPCSESQAVPSWESVLDGRRLSRRRERVAVNSGTAGGRWLLHRQQPRPPFPCRTASQGPGAERADRETRLRWGLQHPAPRRLEAARAALRLQACRRARSAAFQRTLETWQPPLPLGARPTAPSPPDPQGRSRPQLRRGALAALPARPRPFRLEASARKRLRSCDLRRRCHSLQPGQRGRPLLQARPRPHRSPHPRG